MDAWWEELPHRAGLHGALLQGVFVFVLADEAAILL